MTVGITLTDESVIRSWLLSDDGDLISEVSKFCEVVIFCKQSHKDLIANFIENNLETSNRVTVKPLEEFKENTFQKILGFVMRYSEKSDGNLVLIRRMKDKNQISGFDYLLRISVHNIMVNFPKLIILFRALYQFLPNKKYKKILELFEVKLLLCASISNFIYDSEIMRAAKKLSIKTLGTPRGWDNLVSHGYLRVIPDVFFSHSHFMTNCAIQNQLIEKKTIIPMGTSTYQEYLIPNRQDLFVKKRIAIGCVGPRSNPTESIFIDEFLTIATEAFPYFEFVIIQHPKFPHLVNFDYKNTSQATFEYSKANGSLKKYYNYLSSFDLLLTSGSSIGLDALFVGTPVHCFFIDLIDTGYWESSARYLSHRPHYRELIQKLEIPVHDSINSIIKILHQIEKGEKPPAPTPTFFTGFPDFDFKDILLSCLKKYLIHSKL